MVKIKKASSEGHTEMDMSIEEARDFIQAEAGRYLFMDTKTAQLVRLSDMELTDEQVLAMLPIIKGG
jgi:hypothetical protein